MGIRRFRDDYDSENGVIGNRYGSRINGGDVYEVRAVFHYGYGSDKQKDTIIADFEPGLADEFKKRPTVEILLRECEWDRRVD